MTIRDKLKVQSWKFKVSVKRAPMRKVQTVSEFQSVLNPKTQHLLS